MVIRNAYKNFNFLVFILGIIFLSSCTLPSSYTDDLIKNDIVSLKIFGINDFHGQVTDKPNEGGMVNLAHRLLYEIANTEGDSFLVHAGDHVGASPAESALLQDEPSIEFLNIFNSYCKNVAEKKCNVLGAAGNHEFDEGSDEMLRLLQGGNHYKGPFLHEHWHGANYPTLGANVIDKKTKENMLPPYAIYKVSGIPIGFIGITLDTTPEHVLPGIVDNISFYNQADTANKYAQILTEKGVKSIVVVVHDGSEDVPYDGTTNPNAGIVMDSSFGRFVTDLADEIDVLVTGHSHMFTNAYVPNKNGKRFLVTQAFSNAQAFSDISIAIDVQSQDIISASAQIVMTKERSKSKLPKAEQNVLEKIMGLQQESIGFAQSITEEVIGNYQATEDEISLGRFLANSVYYQLKTDAAVMNKDGVRAWLQSGEVTYGDLFAVQPFNNRLFVRNYTGRQLRELINTNEHWSSNVDIYDGHIIINEAPLLDEKVYSVAGNEYILSTPAFSVGDKTGEHGIDLDTTINYIKTLPQPFNMSSIPE